MADSVILSVFFGYLLMGMYGSWRYRRRGISFWKWLWGGSSGWVFSPDEYFVPGHRNWWRWILAGFIPAMLIGSGVVGWLARGVGRL